MNLAQHIKAGQKLAFIKQNLGADSFNAVEKRLVGDIFKITTAIDRLRCDLDSELFRNFIPLDENERMLLCRVYYSAGGFFDSAEIETLLKIERRPTRYQQVAA